MFDSFSKINRSLSTLPVTLPNAIRIFFLKKILYINCNAGAGRRRSIGADEIAGIIQ